MPHDDRMTPIGIRTRGLLLGMVVTVAAGPLAGCVARSEYDRVVADNKALRQQVDGLEKEVSGQVGQIIRLQNAIKYTVNSDLLFPPGRWEMSQEGKDVIAKLAWQLAGTQKNKLYVTGYTDNAPVGPELARLGVTSNEVLSQRRADDVAEFLVSQGVRRDLLVTKGMGESNPIASNATPQGRAQNRRVQITLAPPALLPSS